MMVKTKKEIEFMSIAGRVAAEIMMEIISYIKEGVTGLDVDVLILKMCKEKGVEPAFFGFNGYRYNSCISVNEAVIHCEPSNNFFVKGDMVKIDFGISYKGYCSDMARTVVVGIPSEPQRLIIDACRSIFDHALSLMYPGRRIGDISHAIHKSALSKGYDVIPEFSSHGIGTKVHEPPQIPHYGLPNRGAWLFSGMTFAIEPIIREFKGRIKNKNDWCIITDPPCLSAHYEDTVLITDNGPMVLTTC